LISQCAGVAEAAVIGVKDEKWGERPLALVVKRASDAIGVSDADIKDHLKMFATKASSRNTEFRRRSCSSTHSKTQRRQDQQEGTARTVRVSCPNAAAND